MDDEIEAKTVAHYVFCGPPKVSDYVPPTIVLNFSGEPKPDPMSEGLKTILEKVSSLPADIVNTVTVGSDSGDNNDESPEGCAITALFTVAKALSAYKRRGADNEFGSPSAKKSKTVGDGVQNA